MGRVVKVLVRAAVAKDKQAVLAFCRNTFDWGDYIPEVWDDWLADAGGKLFVGVVGERPIGVLHLVFLDRGQVWLEGMRVHPDWRRKRVGTAMDAEARAVAHRLGYRTARLATSIHNIPAQKTLATQGYTPLCRFNEWTAKPEGGADAVSVGTVADVRAILTHWEDCDAKRAGNSLLPDEHWRWCTPTESRVKPLADAGEIRTVSGGFAVLHPSDDEEGSRLFLYALCGDAPAAQRLASAARAEAFYRGYERVEAMIADSEPSNRALGEAGYVLEGGMLIYEQSL